MTELGRFVSMAKIWLQVKGAVQHAFSIHSSADPLSAEEVALLDQIATVVVSRRMANPAVLFLESAGPMNFLGGQALYFLMPLLEFSCEANEIERVARLLERRDTFTRLIALIEAKASHDPSTSQPICSGHGQASVPEPGRMPHQ